MKTSVNGLLAVLTMALLAGCGYEHGHGSDNSYSYTEVIVTSPADTAVTVNGYEPLPPVLRGFFLMDSYGYSAEFDPAVSLAINPYIDNGWFELYWRVDSWDDYWVEIYVNDRPDWDEAVYVGSQLCGFGLECDEEGLQYCRYDLEFGLSCDTGEEFTADLSPLIYVIPQTLYVFLQVCDPEFVYCEYDFYPVLFE